MVKEKITPLQKAIIFGVIFITASLIINYIYRNVLYSVILEHVVLKSDPHGYYQYLPVFFLNDWAEFKNLYWAVPYGDGYTLSYFTCGVAILWSPFFLIAHHITIFSGIESDGYGDFHYLSVIVAAIVYVYIALYFLFRSLIKVFSTRDSLITVLLFFLGTNLFYYTVIMGQGMSHAYSFTMIAVYIYYVHRYFETRKLKHLILFALPFALAVLIRPTNIISGFYFFLYGVYNRETFKDRMKFWLNNLYVPLVVLIIGFIVAIPQMLYWHTVTGKFLVYSYQTAGFPFLTNPKIATVLVGIKNGWFTYTPLVLFALYGLYKAIREKKYNGPAILVILILAIYINASWWAPTFSAAVGQRAMIDFLPLLAFPMAMVVRSFFEQSFKIKSILLVVLLAIIYFNIKFAISYDSWAWWNDPFSWRKLMYFLKL